MGNIKEQKRNEVKKHVAVIHCTNTLSLLQRKISNALLYHAYPDLQAKEEYEISVKQLCSIIGYNGNNHAVIKEALKGLISVVIEWNLIDQDSGEEDWTASSIIACARIKGPKCTYSYSPRMRNLLFSPSMYGKINLIVQARFKSNYGLALYENCIRYKGLPYTRWFEIETFRKLMGVAPDTYLIFRDLKKRIIDKSIEEVNAYSDLIVTPEFTKIGRKVTTIRFKLKEREKKKLGLNLQQSEKTEIIDNNDEAHKAILDSLIIKLQNHFYLSARQIEILLRDYKCKYIEDKIKLLENSEIFLSGRIKNISAYFLSSLKYDYQDSNTSHVLAKKKIKDNEIQQMNLKNKLHKEEANKKLYSDYISKYIDKILDELEYSIVEKLKSNFILNLMQQNNQFIIQKYNKEGFNNKLVKVFFQNYFEENYPGLLKNMLDYQTFLANNLDKQGSLLSGETHLTPSSRGQALRDRHKKLI